MRTATRIHGLTDLCLISVVGIVTGCGSVVSTTGSSISARATSTSSTPTPLPRPCSFLTQAVAAQISGDPAVTNQATDATETESGYIACIFADTTNEANSMAVQIRRVRGGADPSTLREAATFFSLGEPVQPFQRFPVAGVGDSALGATTPGVAFIVFSSGDLLVYVGADSSSVSPTSLRASVENLAQQVDEALQVVRATRARVPVHRANRSTRSHVSSVSSSLLTGSALLLRCGGQATRATRGAARRDRPGSTTMRT